MVADLAAAAGKLVGERLLVEETAKVHYGEDLTAVGSRTGAVAP
jgi:hypothetical protein